MLTWRFYVPESLPKNPIASISARLKNEAAKMGLTADQLRVMPLQMAYAHQGFLARLDLSPHAERFAVKGGASLFARYRNLGRPTRDLDLASPGLVASEQEVRQWIEDIIQQPFGDYLSFPLSEIQVRTVTPESAAHPVISVRLHAYLGMSRQIVDLDLSFGSVVHPGICYLNYPRLIIPDAVRLRAYPLEQTVAEKFAAMIELSVANTRMKDFHDLWQIARYDSPEASNAESARGMAQHDLREAVYRSFQARGTPLQDLPHLLGPAFTQDSEIQDEWARYRKKNAWADLPEFEVIMKTIRGFAGETALTQPTSPPAWWNPASQQWEIEELPSNKPT